jgi:hemerythrin
MTKFILTADLLTGVKSIDGHHRTMFEMANRVVAATFDGKQIELFQETLSFLQGYVLYHFAAEEHVMKKTGYPRYEPHRNWHEQFRQKVSGYMNRAQTRGISRELTLEISYAIEDWLKEHIRITDKDLASHLNAHEDKTAIELPTPGTLKKTGELPMDFNEDVTVIYEEGYKPGIPRTIRGVRTIKTPP